VKVVRKFREKIKSKKRKVKLIKTKKQTVYIKGGINTIKLEDRQVNKLQKECIHMRKLVENSLSLDRLIICKEHVTPNPVVLRGAANRCGTRTVFDEMIRAIVKQKNRSSCRNFNSSRCPCYYFKFQTKFSTCPCPRAGVFCYLRVGLICFKVIAGRMNLFQNDRGSDESISK
jgi:hypothetical protein